MSNGQIPMTNDQSNPKTQCPKSNGQTTKKYDLADRTTKFSKDIMERGPRIESYIRDYN